MNMEIILNFLFYSMCFHIGFLAWWLIIIIFFKKITFKYHSKIFSVTENEMSRIHYLLIGYYKITITVFIIIPYLVLKYLI